MQRYNPNSPQQRQRLLNAVSSANSQLAGFRKTRRRFYKEVTGQHYSATQDRRSKKVPLPMLSIALGIYVRRLCPPTPRCLVVANQTHLTATASTMQEAVNTTASEINVGETLREVVTDAIMSPLGAVKMGVTEGDQVEIAGILHDMEQPYVDPIELDDLVYDTQAPRVEQLDFVGNYYDVPTEYVKENRMFRKNVRELAQPSQRYTADRRDADRTNSLGASNKPTNHEPLRDKTRLLDVYLPYDRLLCTFLADNERVMPLAAEKWTGPEKGPYKFLFYDKLPGMVTPVAPAMQWYDTHMLLNNVFRKVARGAERFKRFGVASGANDDGPKVRDVDDGEIINLKGQGVTEVTTGGADPGLLAFANMVKQEFGYVSGNIDLLGGLQNQTAGFGHDKMLTEQASEKLKDMQIITAKFISEIFKDLAWYNWHNPIAYVPVRKRVKGTDIEIESAWTPDSKMGDLIQYNFRVEPHGLVPKSPGERLQLITSLMGSVVAPWMEQFAAQGIEVDLEQLMETIANYADIPEFKTIVRPSHGDYNPNQRPHSSQKPGGGHYVRESVNGNAPQSPQPMADAASAQQPPSPQG